MKNLFIVLLSVLGSSLVLADELKIAAAADLKFAMEEIASEYRKANPTDKIDLIFGSSGKFFAQIQQGGPYDMFFSADIKYPEELHKNGLATSSVTPYATGRIVLWSNTVDASKLKLSDLTESKFSKIAIANPKHAPYGKRAQEALERTGLWTQIQGKLVYGENIAQTAQFILTGNAQIGVIALSLAKNPELEKQGKYYLIPEDMHQPLEQGYVITKRAESNAAASRFSKFMQTKSAKDILAKYGFMLPK